MRATFSKLKKGVKDRFKGSKRKADKKRADGRGTDTDNDSVEPGASADESGLDWGSAVSSTAKLLLRGVRDSVDAFPPLKSVAGGLCFILENCEVSPSTIRYLRRLRVPQRTKANKQAIESLAPRVKALAKSLCRPVSDDDIEERERRQKLEQ